MVAKQVIDKAGMLGPDGQQVGKFMEKFGLWKMEHVTDELNNFKVSTTPGDGNVSLSWESNSSTRYVAQIIRNEEKVVCMFCTKTPSKPVVWCRHIWWAAYHKLDRPVYNVSVVDTPLTVIIPIIPTHGVFLPVTLIRREDRAAYVEVSANISSVDGSMFLEPIIGHVYSENVCLSELKSMSLDFYSGWLHNPEYFHQEYDDTALGRERQKLAAEIDNVIPDVVHKYYVGTFGMTHGAMVVSRPRNDAPKF